MTEITIPNFTENELWVVRNSLKERYGKEVEPPLADTEVMLSAENPGLAWCPMLFWSAQGANFAAVKIGAQQLRAYFYYHPEHQLGTDIDSHDNIGDCVVQVEADHLRAQKIKTDETPSEPGESSNDKPDLSPNFWGD